MGRIGEEDCRDVRGAYWCTVDPSLLPASSLVTPCAEDNEGSLERALCQIMAGLRVVDASVCTLRNGCACALRVELRAGKGVGRPADAQ
jgi:hypothetical protein